jgi:glycosyltransferase involved in cell wall biosynthesis
MPLPNEKNISNSNRLKVAWIASGFVGRNASGTAQTARKIVEYLIINEHRRILVVLILKNKDELKLVLEDKILSKASTVLLPKVNGQFLKSSRQFYKYAFNKNSEIFDVLHFSVARLYPFYWKFPAKKFFCTFHAGGEITVPQDNFVLSRKIYNIIIRFQWKKLDKIFADSEFGIREIEDYYKIPRARITLVHLGADHLWKIKPKKIQINKSKLNIAIIGRWQKYKNVHSILKAYTDLDKLSKDRLHLFLIGKKNKGGENLVQPLINQIDPNNLTVIDYLTDSELKFIYQNVQLVIHPSINEGFGLPAFEAFGEGAPTAVHIGLPADYYLRGNSQVMTLDMTNQSQITNLLLNVDKFRNVDYVKRRKFLITNNMTWDLICKQYVDHYMQGRK